MREQTRRGSLLESCLNTATGFVVSLTVWRFIVAPAFGLPITMEANLEITGIFTVTSILRSYCWRRAFNWWQRRQT